jgi:hypothetical protein
VLRYSQLTEQLKSEARSDAFMWHSHDCEPGDDESHGAAITERAKHPTNHAEVRAGFKEHAKTLSRSHVNELKYYKHTQEVNHSLRSTPHNEARHELEDHEHKAVKKLDHVTSHHTKGDMHVYRGLTAGHIKRHNGLKPGTTFTDHGYTSASFKKHEAAKYGHKKEKHLIQIHAPKGTKAHHFDSHKNESQHEDEVVFHRGTKFRVTHHSHDGEHHIVHATVVSQRPKGIWNWKK